MQGIYIIKNTINNNSYIGQSVDIERRFKEYLEPSHKSSSKLKDEIKKFGKDKFYYEILELCETNELNEKEREYISKMKPTYNTQSGGGSIHHHSDETKKLLKKRGKEFWESLDEDKKKKIISNLKPTQVGHKVKEETKEKLRQCNLGKKQSIETIEKRKKTILLKKQSGWIRDVKSWYKPIYCVETGEYFKCVKDASEKYNLTTLVGHLKGRYKTCKGKHYKYCSVTTNDDECNRVE